MSESELIYKFLADYPETGVIRADGKKYAVSICKNDDIGAKLLDSYGNTISDAIRKIYESIEKEDSR